jgi:murein DD-endopeptidase MepM/ murein hydrolase activator NlpD
MIGYPFEHAIPITQNFGENPGAYARFGVVAHTGIDYGCPIGTPVLAVLDGQASAVKFDPAGYGNYVMIAHAGGLTSLYGHLSLTVVRQGEMVHRGEILGYSGSTGNSTGPHLHFEVRQAGQEHNGYGGAVDPAPLFEVAAAQPLPALGEQVTVAIDALNVRLQPGGKLVGQVAQGMVLPRAGEAQEQGGITWVPVVMWVAAGLDGQAYLK